MKKPPGVWSFEKQIAGFSGGKNYVCVFFLGGGRGWGKVVHSQNVW